MDTRRRKINKKEERIKQEMLLNRKPIIEQCRGEEKEGEERISCREITNDLCNCYIDPSILWRLGPCPRASHLRIEPKKKSSAKIRVGQQQKQKKKKK